MAGTTRNMAWHKRECNCKQLLRK